MAGFKYKQRDVSALEKRQNQQGSEFQGFIKDEFKTYSVAKGDNFLRILPPTWEDAEHYGLDIYVHYGIGPERATALCLAKMKGERCPICEASVRLEKSGDDEGAKEIKAGKRVLVWMADRKDEAKGPMIWSMPWTLDRDFAKLARDPRSGEVFYIDDPENGYDISFEKTGEKQQTKYVGMQLARRPSSVDQDFVDYIVLNPLPTTLMWRTYDELKTLYEGADAYDAPHRDADRRDDRRDPPPREERREEPRRDDPPASERTKFRPRGEAAPREEPRRDDRREEREPAGASHGLDDDIPFDRDPPRDDRRDDPRDAPRRDPPREERREEPRRDPPPREEPRRDEAPSGKSRAQELKERFGRK